MKSRWYKDAVIYQIYPRSFCDSNGDGIGDLRGIISKLDYLKELGVDAVWLSPIYRSPNDDNGYDISDYRDIMEEFGTLDDFKEMVAGMHERGIRLIMDLVANHTSDEHPWFVESRKSKDNPYRDYYIWRDGKGKNGKKPPNNWTSNFVGPAWKFDETSGQYYLHLFSQKQPDLNWDNPKVRREIADICNYWLELGVDGFRCDVITSISKNPALPDGKKQFPLTGIEHYLIGPRYHEYIHELNQASWSRYDSMTVGEAVGITAQTAPQSIDESVEELDTVFCFDHTTKCDRRFMMLPKKFDLVKFKKVMSDWQNLPLSCQPTLYLENHDQPRSLPRFVGDYGDLRKRAAKMLAVAMLMQRGTPYLYQGQEIGMTNCPFEEDEYADIMSVNVLKTLHAKAPFLIGIAKKVLSKVARDHARTPMQWSAAPNAGFTSGTPWMKVNPNYKEINAQESREDEDGIFGFYQKLLRLRKGNRTVIEGKYECLLPKDKNLFVYTRTTAEKTYLVICNFTDRERVLRLPERLRGKDAACVLTNCPTPLQLRSDTKLRPYEGTVLELR